MTQLETTLNNTAIDLDIDTDAGRKALAIALANIQLLDKKQQDYGSKNISSFGLFGVIVRLNDKFERLKKLTLSTDASGNVCLCLKTASNESIADTFKDISNYSIIAEMLMTNKWPNE